MQPASAVDPLASPHPPEKFLTRYRSALLLIRLHLPHNEGRRGRPQALAQTTTLKEDQPCASTWITPATPF